MSDEIRAYNWDMMNKQAAVSIVNRIASADFNGDGCTEAEARRAIQLASRPGHSDIDGAVDAIKVLGEKAAVEAYLEQWETDYTNEYDEDK